MLASALTKLSTGNLGGFDALKTTSDVLQLDNLDVSQENDNLQVTAGKYLNDKVYFEVDGGAGEVGVGGSVKIELLPQLDLETYYGSGVRDTGIELQWSYDY